MVGSLNQVADAHCVRTISVSKNEQQFYQTIYLKNSGFQTVHSKRTVLILKKVMILSFVIFCLCIGSLKMINQVSYMTKVHTESAAAVKYVVQPGDTLWKIALEKGQTSNLDDSIQKIESMNHLSDNSNIYPGQVLRIPSEYE